MHGVSVRKRPRGFICDRGHLNRGVCCFHVSMTKKEFLSYFRDALRDSATTGSRAMAALAAGEEEKFNKAMERLTEISGDAEWELMEVFDDMEEKTQSRKRIIREFKVWLERCGAALQFIIERGLASEFNGFYHHNEHNGHVNFNPVDLFSSMVFTIDSDISKKVTLEAFHDRESCTSRNLKPEEMQCPQEVFNGK